MRYALWGLMFAFLLLQGTSVGQSSWEEKNQAGEKAFQEGHLAEASRLFTEALRDVQKSGDNDLRLAPIYNNLALVVFVQNNFITAETLYQRAIAVMETQGPGNPLLLPVLDNLTSLYVKQWAFGKAIQTSWHAYHIREKKFGPTSLETAAGLIRLGNLYLDSVRLLPQAASKKSVSGEPERKTPPATVSDVEFENLDPSVESATSLDDVTKLSIAEVLFRRALALEEKAYGAESTRLLNVLQSLGGVLHAEGKTSAAEESYVRAIAVEERSFGADDPKLTMPLQQLAELKAADGSYTESEALYRRTLQITQNQAGTTGASLAPLLTEYADLLQKMDRADEAKALLARVPSGASARTPNKVSLSDADVVPYVLRYEKSAYERSNGFRKTCVLVRADGRFRVEEQELPPQQHSIAAPVIEPGMIGLGAPGETFAERPGAGSRIPKIYESSVDADSLQQLRAILSAKDIRDLQGSYPPAARADPYNSEKIAGSILRVDDVQNFAFPDAASLKPYDEALKPLWKWLSTAEKHKGSPIKGATANNCSPDTPNTTPTQISALQAKVVTSINARTATETAAKQPGLTSADAASTLKVQVNLVLVPVLVRDAQGHAVGTLRQEDFRLLDNGKSQTITKFSVEKSGSIAAAPIASSLNPAAVARDGMKPPDTAKRNVAYLFDDIHLEMADWNQVRSAADRHLASLEQGVRAALFTTSGKPSLDFTDDRTKLHGTLLGIHPRSTGSGCPYMDTYVADAIVNKHDQGVLAAITGDALDCAFGDDPRLIGPAESLAKSTAQQQLSSEEAQSRIVLSAFQNALLRLSATPGQHTLVLVSPGFVAPGMEREFGHLIDAALRAGIPISSLDARGLYTVDPAVQRGQDTLPYRRKSAAASDEILATLAYGTGGTLFHSSNDFEAGFTRVTQSDEYYYVLGFSPSAQDLNGQFHTLGVSITGDAKLIVQARKGYYALKP